MVEFIHLFENLVKEKYGQIIDYEASRGLEYYCALLPYEAEIQKHDTLIGGIAIKTNQHKINLSTFFLRKVSHCGILKPCNLLQQDFFPYQLERFVIELFSQIDALKLIQVEETALKYKEAKEGKNSLTLHAVARLANEIIHRTDTLQVLNQYISAEDQRGLNPMGVYGKRLRSSQVLDRFDAANAVSALASDTADHREKWHLMELAGRILWEVSKLEEWEQADNFISKLNVDRNTFYPNEE